MGTLETLKKEDEFLAARFSPLASHDLAIVTLFIFIFMFDYCFYKMQTKIASGNTRMHI